MRGYPIEELIGAIGFVDMVWLLLRGDLPTKEQARFLEATLVASVDHGPVAPSAANRADGDHLRPARQWGARFRHQCSRRRARRARGAVHGALPRDRRGGGPPRR
jgi:citrate synthase